MHVCVCFIYIYIYIYTQNLFQDGLLSAGYGDLITRIHNQIPKVTPDGKRLQMIVCSATLHSFDVKKMAVCRYLYEEIQRNM